MLAGHSCNPEVVVRNGSANLCELRFDPTIVFRGAPIRKQNR
jgi:hypothetical protein